MPRARTHSEEDIVAAAMKVFWRRGYEAASMDDLVRETGVSRHALYSVFPGKEALFQACLEAYALQVVSAAFEPVEAPGARLDAVAAYFEMQIAYAERLGLPGPGCLMANSMTERAPHDAPTQEKVKRHNARLQAGFFNALSGEAAAVGRPVDKARLRATADLLTVFANGLWSTSRVEQDAATLRSAAQEIVDVARERITR